MKTIICKFKSNGKDIKKTAILNNSLDELSKSNKNEATDIIEEGIIEMNEWSIMFEESDTLCYEIVFEYDQENQKRVLKANRAITWEASSHHDSIITDVQAVFATIK